MSDVKILKEKFPKDEKTPNHEEKKQQRLLNIIAVRLDNVKDVTKRSRLAFLITTIASCAILITIWNVYFSTARNVALDDKLTNDQLLLSSDKSQNYYVPIMQLHEYNRRELVKDWIKNLNVSIDLLGIELNINDFPFIGGLSMCVVCFWLFFTFRRENRAIVSLLRDVKKDLKLVEANKKDEEVAWDIANYAFHGVANSLIFFTTGTNDRPLSYIDIFDEEHSKFQIFLDNSIGILTKLIRKLAMILIFFPALTIGLMIVVDEYSTYNVKSPFSPENKTPAERMKESTPEAFVQIFKENIIGSSAGVLTLFICIGCFTFQHRTTRALQEFEKALKGKRDDHNFITNKPEEEKQ